MRPGFVQLLPRRAVSLLSLCMASGKPIMSNEEFDNLKENLLWEGSKVAIMSKNEMVKLQ